MFEYYAPPHFPRIFEGVHIVLSGAYRSENSPAGSNNSLAHNRGETQNGNAVFCSGTHLSLFNLLPSA